MIISVCATCGEKFTKPHNPSRTYKYCSMSCMGTDPEKRRAHGETMKGRFRAGEDRNCLKCGEVFYAQRYRIEKGEGLYCSNACATVGNTHAVGQAPPNKGIPMSAEQRTKLSRAATGKTGSRSNAWRGGLTSEHALIRSSLAYREWRTAVFVRDDCTCQECGVRGGELHADHIKQFAYFPELRFDLDNGRTLCVPCHRATETWGRNLALAQEA